MLLVSGKRSILLNVSRETKTPDGSFKARCRIAEAIVQMGPLKEIQRASACDRVEIYSEGLANNFEPRSFSYGTSSSHSVWWTP